jgi:hypothetical protein
MVVSKKGTALSYIRIDIWCQAGVKRYALTSLKDKVRVWAFARSTYGVKFIRIIVSSASTAVKPQPL